MNIKPMNTLTPGTRFTLVGDTNGKHEWLVLDNRKYICLKNGGREIYSSTLFDLESSMQIQVLYQPITYITYTKPSVKYYDGRFEVPNNDRNVLSNGTILYHRLGRWYSFYNNKVVETPEKWCEIPS